MTAGTTTPPIAEPRPHRWNLAGVTLDDPYAWLENRNDPEVIAYLEAENAYREAALAPTRALQERLYQEMLGRVKQTDQSAPVRFGEWLYYTRTEEGQQYEILARKRDDPDADEEILLDLNQMVGPSGYIRLFAWEPSPDHRYLAYRLNESGGLEGTLYIKDLTTGERLPEVFSPASWEFAWTNDSKALYYVRQDAALRPFELWRHVLGDDPARDDRLYHEDDAVFYLGLRKAKDNSYIFVPSASSESAEVRYIAADSPDGELTLFEPKRPAIEYSLEHDRGDFLVLTNDHGRNFRLVGVPASDPTAERRELIPHRDDVLLQHLEVFADRIAVFGRERGLGQLYLLDAGTGDLRMVEFPDAVYALRPGRNPEYGSQSVRVEYSSPITPRTTFDVDLARGALTLLKQDEVPSGHDPSQYVTERLEATATDGVAVPISLVRRRDQPPGPRPLLLMGYGSYGFSNEPSFNANRLSLLDRGVGVAIAHIRGGQELGRHWYDDGKLLKKKNTFTDFIACADYLVGTGRTTPEQLVITGGSAGGLLMGAVLNLRPDLARAVVAAVPFVDVMRVMLDESLPLTSGEFVEWGDPRDPEYRAYIGSYSPYDNVTNAAYPEMLITAGLSDDQVPYWQPAKWLAKLRQHTTSDRPLYLRIHMGAGHAGSSGRYDSLREAAHDYAFMLRAWGLAGTDAETA